MVVLNGIHSLIKVPKADAATLGAYVCKGAQMNWAKGRGIRPVGFLWTPLACPPEEDGVRCGLVILEMLPVFEAGGKPAAWNLLREMAGTYGAFAVGYVIEATASSMDRTGTEVVETYDLVMVYVETRAEHRVFEARVVDGVLGPFERLHVPGAEVQGEARQFLPPAEGTIN